MKGIAPVCAGCRFYSCRADEGSRCTRSAVTQIDVVTGDRVSVGAVDCWHERNYGPVASWLYGKCGQEGRYFKPVEGAENGRV